MKKTYYMKSEKDIIVTDRRENLGKIGGVPTHKPPYYPQYPNGDLMGFMMEIYYDEYKFPKKEGVLCWQFYQDPMGGPIEEVIEVPIEAQLNVDSEGEKVVDIEECAIVFEEGEEPDIWDLEDINLSRSKIGGAIPEYYTGSDYVYVGTIFEDICDDFDLNFGTVSIDLCFNKEGKLVLEY